MNEEIKDGRVSALRTNTIDSIVQYIKIPTGPAPEEWIVHVQSHNTVVLTTHPTGVDMERDVFMIAEANAPGFPTDKFLESETFMISAMARLYESAGKRLLLDFVGDIQDIEEQRVRDNGTGQTITAKSGIASVADKEVPNPVELAPFRTFCDVSQPISPFILRVRKGPEVGIFEADGGAWKTDAIRIIADHIRTALSDYTDRPVHIIA